MTEAGLFGEGATAQAADAALIEAYERVGRTLDDLPYTDEFKTLMDAVSGVVPGTQAEVFRRLHNLRKAGKLPRLGRAPGSAPRLDPDHEATLTALVERHVGKLSLRDRLVYRPEFDAVVESFNAATALGVTHHDLWRVVAKLAK
ncbi:MAG: hypothetical protein AAFY08_14225 [Planctomycetota bacterium]